jgi:hypothetical protein
MGKTSFLSRRKPMDQSLSRRPNESKTGLDNRRLKRQIQSIKSSTSNHVRAEKCWSGRECCARSDDGWSKTDSIPCKVGVLC